MEKEILKQILSQLEDFKKDQFTLLIVVFFVFIIIQILQAVYTSRLIEKYRNELKKKEMKFSLYNELQVKSLSSLYGLINALKSGSSSIYGHIRRGGKDKFELDNWNTSYLDFNLFLDSNKYILPREVKQLITNYTKEIIGFNGNIQILNVKLEILFESKNEQDQELIEITDKEIEGYNFEKSVLEIMIFCEKLKEEIEKYFEKLQ